jgi:hypothetical protein
MKKNYLLSVLLVLQVLVAYFVISGGDELQGHAGIQKLLEFNREQVDGIRIQDNDGNLAELKSEGDAWLTAEGFPVNVDRIDRLLERLNGLEHSLAVASSPSSAKRFEVSGDRFQRHLKLLNDGEPVAEFYLGTGAGARRNHVRLADQDKIYAVAIGSYDLPAEIADWQDKDLLQIEVSEIQSIVLEGLTIRRIEQSEDDSQDTESDIGPTEWFADGLAEDETFKSDEFETQLRNLATLRFDRAFMGSFEEQVIKAKIVVSYGDQGRTYEFAESKEGDNFWLKVTGFEELFEVSQYNGNRIIDNLTGEKLVEKPEPDEDPEEDAGNNLDAAADPPETSSLEE